VPEAAFWAPEGGMALLMYNDLRKMDSPKFALLGFLESAYQAGARTVGWDIEGAQNQSRPLSSIRRVRPPRACWR
jgi:hypothetical protein